jgi:hypothetical protein
MPLGEALLEPGKLEEEPPQLAEDIPTLGGSFGEVRIDLGIDVFGRGIGPEWFLRVPQSSKAGGVAPDSDLLANRPYPPSANRALQGYAAPARETRRQRRRVRWERCR